MSAVRAAHREVHSILFLDFSEKNNFLFFLTCAMSWHVSTTNQVSLTWMFQYLYLTLANSHGMPKFHLFPLKSYILVVKHHIQILESGQEWIKFDRNQKPLHSPPLKQSSTNGKQGLSVDQWERRSTARKLIQPLLVQVTALHSCKMSLKPHFRHFRIVILIILVNKYSFISMQLSTMHHKIHTIS